MALNSFRLQSDSLFLRKEEDNPEKPLSFVCLAVEGNVTESDYFTFIEKYKDDIGIKKGLHVKVLERDEDDHSSAPNEVLDLLQEYVDMSDEEKVLSKVRSFVPEEYTDEYLKKYLRGEVEKDSRKEDLDICLRMMGFSLEYYSFIKDYKSEYGDVFGIVIDRDHFSHTTSQLRQVYEECTTEGYKVFITNPCFEFWLLLHVKDIKNDDSFDMEKSLNNSHVTRKHTYTSQKLHEITNHGKHISEDKFVRFYKDSILTAIERCEGLEVNVSKLIGDDDNPCGKLGSSLPELFNILMHG